MTHNEYRQRLYDAAEAFYFAGILTSLPFEAHNEVGQRDLGSAAIAMVSGGRKLNRLGAPPLVNFAFSIELYIKLLLHLADASCMRGHNLYDLFLELEKAAPDVARIAICKHHYTRGDRDEFLDHLEAEAKVFEEWRYAYEKEFLCSSADALFTLANAFRGAIMESAPHLTSAFVHRPSPTGGTQCHLYNCRTTRVSDPH